MTAPGQVLAGSLPEHLGVHGRPPKRDDRRGVLAGAEMGLALRTGAGVARVGNARRNGRLVADDNIDPNPRLDDAEAAIPTEMPLEPLLGRLVEDHFWRLACS